jgi:alkylation response protein AidB-like acyl-CoA dehydrogenase
MALPRRAPPTDAGERADMEAGMAKLFASETGLQIATEWSAVQP